MRKVWWLCTVALGLCTGSVHAQGFYPGASSFNNRPAYSPYLNLTRRDAPLINQYYGLVRPEINFRNALGQLDTQQTTTANQQTALENSLTLPPTGHASRFLTHGSYFLNSGGQGGGAQFAAPAGPAPGGQAATPAKGARR